MYHNTGTRFQKTSHEKAKPKNKKTNKKYVEESPLPSADEAAERTLSSLSRLGTQTFALSPFSQYYDDWLINIRQVVSDFEANPSVNADEPFVAVRTRVLAEVEGELAKLRIREGELNSAATELAKSNHLLVELDAAYATQSRELSAKRNSELESLTRAVHELEDKVAATGQQKTSFFGFTKKDKAKNLEETTLKLNAAKKELEMAAQNFTVEQDKLHDEYTKKKQDTIAKVQTLEKEVADIETDMSAQPRIAATSALADAVRALKKRKPVTSTQ